MWSLKNVGKATLVPLDRSWPSHPKKETIQRGDAFEDTSFKSRFKDVKFWTRLYSLSSSHLCEIDSTNGFLTSSSCRYVLQLFNPGLDPSLTDRKWVGGLTLTRNLQACEHHHLHIYSLCFFQDCSGRHKDAIGYKKLPQLRRLETVKAKVTALFHASDIAAVENNNNNNKIKKYKGCDEFL